VVLIGMTCVLTFGCIMSFKKFLKKRAEEKERDKAKLEDAYASMQNDMTHAKPQAEVIKDDEDDVVDPRTYIQQMTNGVDVIMLVIICLLNPLLAVLRGGKHSKSIIGNVVCSTTDVIIVCSYLAIVAILTVVNSARMKSRAADMIESEKQLVLGGSNLIKILFGLFMVGMIGSFLSAGMAVLFSLTLIFSGLSPFVASPTALIMTCMTSASSTFLYVLAGKIHFMGGLIGSAVILFCSMGTRLTIYKILMKSGKESVIMMFIIILVGMAIPVNIWKVVPKIKAEMDATPPINIWAFGGFCDAAKKVNLADYQFDYIF
jgi:hypothetical protein